MSIGGRPRRIGLVGCVKEKATKPAAAAELYTSVLFRGRRSFVEWSCDEWWILSALHGLVHPEDVLEPYDVTLKSMPATERRLWSAHVVGSIEQRIQPRLGEVIELHCGAEYRDFGLVEGLQQRGVALENPTHGMPIGKQLSFYKGNRR